MKTATQTIINSQSIPNTLSVIRGTQSNTSGEYLKICDLGNLIYLVAKRTPRTIKFLIMYPASGLIDSCRMEEVYSAKFSRFCPRHIEHAIDYATDRVNYATYGLAR
jgi:hypothetical protein